MLRPRVHHWTSRITLMLAPIAAALIAACGGKVLFDTSGSGAGGTSSSSGKSTAASTGAGMKCLTTVTVGSGPLGPSEITGTKCFSLTKGSCPPASQAAPSLKADSCYMITAVNDQCTELPSQCCYDITEELVCDG
jgi:hypothetical protein